MLLFLPRHWARNLTDYSRTKLALKKKEIFSRKAKENLVKSGEQYGKGLANSPNPIETINTREAVAKLEGTQQIVQVPTDPPTRNKTSADNRNICYTTNCATDVVIHDAR